MIDRSLPLVELHRHIEGSVRLDTVLELSARHGLPLPFDGDPALIARFARMDRPLADMMEILPKFNLYTQILVDYDACRRITRECLEDAAAEGIDYIELRFSPLFMAEPHGLDHMSVTAAVCDAWREASEVLPIKSRLIVIMSRTYGPEACELELQAALAHRERGIVALDLAGDEARFPAALFHRHFRVARSAGLHLTAHAGEFRDHQGVREAIEELGPSRIGHGVHAADDQATLDILREKGIAIECCPTSNWFTCAIPSLEVHPLPIFVANGIRTSINTDDPSLFGGISTGDEYGLCASKIGLKRSELRQVQLDALQSAFLDESERQELLRSAAERSNAEAGVASPGLPGEPAPAPPTAE